MSENNLNVPKRTESIPTEMTLRIVRFLPPEQWESAKRVLLSAFTEYPGDRIRQVEFINKYPEETLPNDVAKNRNSKEEIGEVLREKKIKYNIICQKLLELFYADIEIDNGEKARPYTLQEIKDNQ